MTPILQIKNLSTDFTVKKQKAAALRNVSTELNRGETLVVLGESGSGKSTLMKAVLKILPNNAEITGSAIYNGEDLISMREKELRNIRGNKISMIFQNSLSALDPMYKIGRQIEETILAHMDVSKKEAKSMAIELLSKVGIPSPAERAKAYPHEMSGGMRQRAVIAMALACGPDILLADEPTTALDVTIQKQILNLFKSIQKENEMALMLVTHDIGVAAQVADKIVVMYGGIIVESGTAEDVLLDPINPYTKALLASMPQKGHAEKLSAIPGQPPMITKMPAGCPFSDRCAFAKDICRKELPVLQPVSSTHSSACHIYNLLQKGE